MMTNSQLAAASLNDIVFDGRNRRYGAYELRGLYQRHLVRALVIATAIFALLIAFPLVARLLKKADPVVVPGPIVEVNPTFIDLPVTPKVVPPPPTVQPPLPPPTQPTIKNVVPVIVEDEKAPAESEIPEQKDMEGKVIGHTNSEGDPNAETNNAIAELKNGPGGGGGDGGGTPEAAPSKPYKFVEQMPELPGGGGTAAIVAAILRSVKYPSLALRNGVEGKVFVSFTVDPTGKVTDVQIVKGLGSGLDEETVRAINTLPRFIPGRQNGREVSVSFTVPVTYRIQ